MRAAKVRMSTTVIEQALHLPFGTEIVDAKWDSPWVVFTLRDESFPDVEIPPEINPTVTQQEWQWKWGYPS